MNSLERIDAVLNGRKADRIPVALHNYLQVARVTGIDDLEAWFFDGPAMAESHTHVWNEVGHDMIQLENSPRAMAHAIGCEVTNDKTLPPHVSRPRLESYSDLDGLELDHLTDPELVARTLGDRRALLEGARRMGESTS